MTERQIWKGIHVAFHAIAACYLWKFANPGTDYNSLPTLAAVVFGGILSYYLLGSLKESPSHDYEKAQAPELWKGKPSYFFRELTMEDAMHPTRPWPKPVPQPPPKTDWELYLEDALGEMPFSDFYEKWRGRLPRRPKKNAHHQSV